MIANVLSIAGSDPSGGAGIQADIKAISANGCYAMAVIAALTAQNTRAVTAVEFVDPDFISEQIAAIRSDIRIDAVKIGMLGNAATVAAVATALDGYDGPIVLDPVMVSKSGARLLQPAAVEALRTHLLPRATLVTPNIPEAADLLNLAEAGTTAQMTEQARALLEFGSRAVLIKGGHLEGNESPDHLATADGVRTFPSARHTTANTHGTGCTYSSALAAFLARGFSLPDAVAAAKSYVFEAIASSGDLEVGNGHGPTHHFHRLWGVGALER